MRGFWFSLLLTSNVFALSEGFTPVAKTFNEAADIKVSVDLSSANGAHKINSKFYGSQISNFVPNPSSSVMKGLGLGMIRIGGNLYDGFNWKNGFLYIPLDVPKKSISFEEFARYFKANDVEPIFQVNFLGRAVRKRLPEDETTPSGYVLRDFADESFAADLVKHLNGSLGLGVKHFCMGNEPMQWMDTHIETYPFEEPLTADQYIDKYVSYALAMRKAQDEISGNANDIKLWGPEISISYYDWQTGNMTKDCEWTDIWGQISCHYGKNDEFDQFLPYMFHRLSEIEKDKKLNPRGYKLLDYASFHYYPNFRTEISDVDSIITHENGKQKIQQILDHTRVLDDPGFTNTIDISSYRNFSPNILGRMSKWMKQYYPDAKLALSEFAVDSFDTSYGYHPIIRPLYMADIIGRLAGAGVSFFGRAFLNTYDPYKIPWVLIENDRTTPLYDLYAQFTHNFVGSILNVEVDSNKWVSVYASLKGEDKKQITVVVVNKSPASQSVSIKIKGSSKEHPAVNIDQPGWSVRFYKIPARGKKIQHTTFGPSDLGIEADLFYLDHL
ncbi:MAG: hypothetical protein HOE90_05060 [Bacteriovoracaceae bacterium]|jgi:hypothetical protein|nr:hypothetical protein [Bacteriovoracaceae bacterium]